MVQRGFLAPLRIDCGARAPAYRLGDIEVGGVVHPSGSKNRFCSSSFPVTERRNGRSP